MVQIYKAKMDNRKHILIVDLIGLIIKGQPANMGVELRMHSKNRNKFFCNF